MVRSCLSVCAIFEITEWISIKFDIFGASGFLLFGFSQKNLASSYSLENTINKVGYDCLDIFIDDNKKHRILVSKLCGK
jgi:hypothetical protein